MIPLAISSLPWWIKLFLLYVVTDLIYSFFRHVYRLVRVTILEHDLRIRAEALGIIPQGDKKAFRRYLEMADERHRDGVGQ